MITPRDSASATGFLERLYVFGGYSNNNLLDTIERLRSPTHN